jgi:hypothetical protein
MAMPENREASRVDSDLPGVSPVAPPPLVPINSPELRAILSADLTAKEKENAQHFPKSVIHFLGGVNWMGTGYVLNRGDDSFEKIGGAALAGGYVDFNPTWPLEAGGPSGASLSFSLSLGVGYFRGNMLMRRTGVQTGDAIYPINTTPVNVEAGPVIALWNKVGLQLTYGLVGEVFHQTGLGENDTVTQLAWADTASAALRFHVVGSFEGYVGWRWRGLVLGSAPHIHAGMLAGGLGYQFAD